MRFCEGLMGKQEYSDRRDVERASSVQPYEKADNEEYKSRNTYRFVTK